MNTIHLYGTCGQSFWDEEYYTAAQVRETLAGMSGPVTVRINSGGGIASEGQAIYTMLRDYPDKVSVVVDAVAASAASLIAMAGDKITMRDGAWMLIHDPATPWLEARGTEADHMRAAKQLGVIAGAYASVYAKRAGISREEARQIMKDETVLDGAMAVQMGFADATEDTPAEPVARFDYRVYSHAPASARQASESLGEGRGRVAILASIAGVTRIPHMEAGMAQDTTLAEASQTDPARSPVAAERKRAKRITEMTMAAGLPVTMATEMIDEGLTLEAASDRIVAKRAEEGGIDRVSMGPAVGRDFTRGPDRRAKMIAGVEALLDPRNATPMGRDAAQMGFGGMVMQLARDAGHRVFTPTEAFSIHMSSHSTSDFPLILNGAMGNTVARRIAQAMPALAGLSREISRDDYRAARNLTLSATSTPQEVAEGGEIQFVTADEKGEFLPTPRDFASGFNFTNRAMVNDSTALNLLGQIGDRMAQGAIERLRAVLLEPLLANSGAGQNMADGNPLFRTQRGNLAASGAVLSVTTLDAARVAMRRQKGLQGELLAIEPKFLLVPPELETLAQQVVTPLQAAEVSKVNPFEDALEVVVEPGLVSTTAWYLCADPAIYDGLTHCFLDGQSSPRIESRPAWETLGMQFRLSWALDAKFVEHATWYRNAGA